MNVWRVPVDPATGTAVGAPEPVTAGVQGTALHLSLSRDGRRIAFASWNARETLRAVAIDPARGVPDGPPRRLERFPEGWHSPSPSPDGKWLALARDRPDEDLVITRPDGSGARPLTRDAARDRAPRWSPRGDAIAFHSDRGGNGMDVWIVAPDGTGMRRLTDAKGRGAVFPVWSPDGRRIAFSDDAGRSFIVAIEDRGTEIATPVPLPAVPGTVAPFTASSWSADGKTIAGSAAGVVLYDVGSRTYRRVTKRGDRPTWLGAGPWLLYWDDRALRAVDARTGTGKDVVAERPDTAGRIFGVTAAGRELFFSLVSSDAQVWVGELVR
jgi:Tol biopolymer transport system component